MIKVLVQAFKDIDMHAYILKIVKIYKVYYKINYNHF